MLSPRAIRLLLRHFDAIDQVVAKRLTRKRPWAEEALTSLLCDLLDSETQAEENVSYTLRQLHDDLARTDEPVRIRLRIDSHQYPKHLERWVTQADFGLIVKYEDHFEPRSSATSAWLLQAKRVFPSPNGSYESISRFASTDAAQDTRMKALRDWASEDFIRYFFYCPRPKELQQHVREELTHSRTHALSGELFDFTLGLELRDDMLSDSPTIAAGLFVASLDHTPKTLAETHAALFSRTFPFAWFIVQHLAKGVRRISHPASRNELVRSEGPRHREIERLVRGDHRVLDDLDLPKSLSQNVLPRVLPAHTIEILVDCGHDRPRQGDG
jgi:hypothetical protein